MPFVKLDCGILTSTLWMDRAAREVFITALLMAEPVEFDEPIEEVATRTLDHTGWSAPPGWYGFVPAAGVGIIRNAGLDREAGMDALERLAAPDEDSRSREFEGRRMIRISGGYLILNYMKYRDRDYTGAERQRRYRKRKQGQRNGVTDDSNGVTSRLVTQAEAEAELEAKEEPDQSSQEFDEIRAAYPKRAGGDRLKDARSAYRARLREGAAHEAILDGVKRYAAFCEATDKVGTPYVQQLATFLGTNRGYLELWTPPRKVETPAERRQREAREKMAAWAKGESNANQ